MSRTAKSWITRIACAIISLAILNIVVLTNMTNAVVANAAVDMDNAIRMNTIAAAMKNCASSSHVKRGILFPDDVNNHDIFQDVFELKYTVGTWVEAQMEGSNSSVNNGQIKCNTNKDQLITAFAKELGKSYDEIICGKNGSDGLLMATDTWYGLSVNKVEGHCGESGYAYTFNDNAQAYLESLYNEWAQNNPYATSWEDVGTYTDEQRYRALYYDMVAACGGDSQSSGIPFSYVDEKGTITTRYINPSNPKIAGYFSKAYNGGGDPVSCETLATEVTKLADPYSKLQQEEQYKICFNDTANSIASTTNQSLVDKYKSMRDQAMQTGDYSVFWDEEGSKCADLTDLAYDMSGGEEGEVIEGSDVEEGQFIDPNEQQYSNEEDGPCFDGGVGALGWIICPIIKLLRQTTENLYDYVITPFLEIDMGAFNTDSAVFTGWQIFQSFANIVFVILLLLVIFSQITGYGIDNYGIKRMLPKLIVGAILVNLSFIICQLLVDASNVIGFAVENMFNNWASMAMNQAGADPVGVTSGVAAGVTNGTAIGATIISGAVGIGGAAAAITTAEIWLPVLILPLILGLISIIVSCLFVFVILGARRAAAIILVVIAPLAFVMYMLPNTKKLFDRWYSAFKAVLLVFPIIGLLMGGGAFAGAILWNVSSDASGGGFFLGQLLAALTTVIPFFFIPRILKSSLNAVGNLGTTLSNLGNGISRGLGGITKGAIGNSNWYNNMQSNRKDILEERNRNREQERAQRIVDRLKARGGQNDENLTEAQRRRKYRAQATLNRLQREDVETEAGLTPISRDVELAQAQAKRRQESVNAREDQIRLSGDVDDMGAMRSQLSAAIMDNDDVAIEAYQNVLSGKGEQGRQAVHDAMVNAEASGNVSAEARKAYASNIMNGKFANDYKNNSRSTFEYAKANAGSGSGGNMSSYYGTAVDSLTQQKMVDMDEAELNRYLAAAQDARKVMSDSSASQNARLDAEARLGTITSMASGALNNQRLAQGLKGSQRKVLEQIAGEAPAGDGPVLDVRDNGANRQYDAAMNRAANNNRRAQGNSNPVNQEGMDQYLDMNNGRS